MKFSHLLGKKTIVSKHSTTKITHLGKAGNKWKYFLYKNWVWEACLKTGK